MEKIKILSVLLFVFHSFLMYSQDFCFTNSNIPDFLQTVSQSKYVKTRADDTYVLRVFFHIIKRSNGTGGQTQTEVENAFDLIQSDYNRYGICFELLGTDEIRNDDFYNGNINFACNLNGNGDCDGDGKFDNFHPNSHSNAIDIYLFANDQLNFGVAAGIPSSALAIGGNTAPLYNNTNLVTSHVLSHELGHCLGLYHTFHGLCEGGCAELVNGSNCSTCGDFVCDTPADPQTHQVNQNTCTWNGNTCTGSITDANGQQYNPDPTLIMAYIAPNCMQRHTSGQVARIKDMIANSAILQNVIVPNSISLTGSLTGDNVFSAIETITSTQIINSGSTSYVSGTQISFLPGFEVKAGAFFNAKIDNFCDNTSRRSPINIAEKTNATVNDTQKIISSNIYQEDDPKTFSFSIFPNPTYNIVTVDYTLHTDAPICIELFNMFGQRLKLILPPQNQKAGDYSIQTSVFDLPVGTYFVKVNSVNQTESKSLIINL